MRKIILSGIWIMMFVACQAEDGYDLWLRYTAITETTMLHQYRNNISGVVVQGSSTILKNAKRELETGLQSMLGIKPGGHKMTIDKSIVIGTPLSSAIIKRLLVSEKADLGKDGYIIKTIKEDNKTLTVIAANTDIGGLYGAFAFLRLMQTRQPIHNISVKSVPKIRNRILNHWDNLDRSVERGYAGISIWNWHTLPDYIDQRYVDYARANASIGINGTVLNNVNASSLVLTQSYLEKVKALADVFRSYGIRVYLAARFSAPVEIGGLDTADPLNKDVREWWREKCREIYKLIPDFGGFLIKANSEGQPGPQGYGRTHADGANMFAEALIPYGGIVMWRAFVYDARVQKEDEHFTEGATGDHAQTIASGDRFKQAYNEFKPLDGFFKENVLIQVKNGPIDFQPREPFSPLFGAMPQTKLMMELQVTQEYMGQGTTLAYLAPMFKECLDSDTYSNGKGSTVAKVVDGSLGKNSISGIAGVANIGNDRNWTGHLFGQSNWYAFGRLAWDHALTSADIADEWIKQTFTDDIGFVKAVKEVMLVSREVVVDYMTPLGLNHIMGTGHHYGPAPWVANAGRADWNPVYYHKADKEGIGFDRTATGSNALAQYAPEAQKLWQDINSCDEKFILWFHHVPWNYVMKSARTLWEELCHKYYAGADSVGWMQNVWLKQVGKIDEERFHHVNMLLNIQRKEAEWWRNACLLYFQKFSKQPIPRKYEQPRASLHYYERLTFPFAPGIKNIN